MPLRPRRRRGRLHPAHETRYPAQVHTLPVALNRRDQPIEHLLASQRCFSFLWMYRSANRQIALTPSTLSTGTLVQRLTNLRYLTALSVDSPCRLLIRSSSRPDTLSSHMANRRSLTNAPSDPLGGSSTGTAASV